MKLVITICGLVLAPALANAQQGNSPYIDRDMFNICAAIFVAVILMLFALSVLKKIMDHRIKSKILERGLPSEPMASIFRTDQNEEVNNAVKWFLLLLGTAAGFAITNLFLPLGLHSLAIMAASIAAGFLAYYLYLRRQQP